MSESNSKNPTGFDVVPGQQIAGVPAQAGQQTFGGVQNPESAVRQNMQLWDKVKTTSTGFTKQASNGRFTFTTVDPQYQLQEATKVWGPYGQAWGLFDLRFTTFETSEKDGSNGYIASTTMMLEATFRYPGGQFPIAVDMKFRPGQDIMKKLTTSARSKALSFLGFSADVFLGKFDDAAYVNDLKIREGEQNAFETKALSSIRTAKTHADLDKMKSRVEQMVTDKTLTGDQGAYLFDEINDRRQHLLEASGQNG